MTRCSLITSKVLLYFEDIPNQLIDSCSLITSKVLLYYCYYFILP